MILRGGSQTGANYDANSVATVRKALVAAGLEPSIMLDCSHANSAKDFRNQPAVAETIAAQIAGGDTSIRAVMIESHLHEGAQGIKPNLSELQYGVSVTDSCVSWETTVPMLEGLAKSVRQRRATFLA